MLKVNKQWKGKTDKYQNGEYLYVNRILIGGFDWSPSCVKSEDGKELPYEARIYLPSLKANKFYGATVEEVKRRMEKIIDNWFTEALRNVEEIR